MVAAPCALALVLGLWGIRRGGSIWRDEVVTYDMAHRSLPDLWHTLQHVDAVHGLYYLFMHGLFAVVGGGVTTLRLPSALAMTAAAAGVALLGTRVAGRRAGIAAGLIFPLLPPVQEYAQEGRSYALVCALVTWSTYLLVRALDASAALEAGPASPPGPEAGPVAKSAVGPEVGSAAKFAVGSEVGSAAVSWLGLFRVPGAARRRWAGYALVTLVACLLHEFAVLVLTAHAVTVVLAGVPSAVRGAVRRTWLVAAVVVVVGLAPQALFSAGQSAQLSWILWPDPVQLATFALLAVVGVLCARVPARARVPVPARLPTPAREAVSVRVPVPPQDPVGMRPLALPLLIAPQVTLMLLSQLKPVYVDRYVLYYVVGFALLAGAALDRVFRPLTGDGPGDPRAVRVRRRTAWALAAVLVGLLPLSVHLRGPESRKDDATAVVQAVRDLAEPGDGLLFTPARRRVWTLSEPEQFRGLTDLALSRSPASSGTLYGTEVSADRIEARMYAAERIVVLGDPHGEPEDETSREAAKRTVLRDSFERCAVRDVTGARVSVYARPGHCND
ncbi:glycosyltransferase family 39 protein [Streptomyces niger]|uniref:glycosyltransferase family 39 protein n=1 Tax=Streptomyces niger TaxID=66373 RepID=UPI000699F7B1